MAEIERFLKGLDRRPPASDAAIRACEEKLGVKLADDYVQLLKASNGCEGLVAGRAFVWLWKVEELPLNNKSYMRLEENPDILGVRFGRGARLCIRHALAGLTGDRVSLYRSRLGGCNADRELLRRISGTALRIRQGYRR